MTRTSVVAVGISALRTGVSMESERGFGGQTENIFGGLMRNVPLRDETGKLVRWYGTANLRLARKRG